LAERKKIDGFGDAAQFRAEQARIRESGGSSDPRRMNVALVPAARCVREESLSLGAAAAAELRRSAAQVVTSVVRDHCLTAAEWGCVASAEAVGGSGQTVAIVGFRSAR
jgi:hypothetical protein